MSRRSWTAKGQVPFAIVAVLLLLLSTVSAAYLSTIAKRHADERSDRLSVERLGYASDAVCSEIEASAHTAALRAVAMTVRRGDDADLDEDFQSAMAANLASLFPAKVSGCDAEVDQWSAWIVRSDRDCIDAVESTATTAEELAPADESEPDSAEGRALDNSRPDEIEATQVPAFYMAAGYVNYTVKAANGLTLARHLEIEREIPSPYPLLRSRMDTLEASASGEFSPVARTVKYILTTLAQFRVLEGFGSGLAASPGPLSSVVSEADIELAMNLAIVLEIARRLRAADPEALAALGTDGSLGSLVRQYAWNGTMDAADIMALYLEMDRRAVPVAGILAQGFSAVIDQFILKIFDYLGMMDALDKCYRAVRSFEEAIGGTVESMSKWLGLDEGEGVDGWFQSLRWAERTVRLLGDDYPPGQDSMPSGFISHGGRARPSLLVADAMAEVTATVSCSKHLTVLLGETESPILNATGVVIGTNHTLSIRSLDYSLATKTSAEAGYPGGYIVRFEEAPLSRAGLETLWENFFDENYSEELDQAYDSLRDELKAVCSHVASEVADYFGAREMTLAAYGGGAYGVDPRDGKALLDDLSRMLDSAFSECFGHYSANRDALKGLLAGVIDGQERMKSDLARFLSEHYDEIVDRDSAIQSASLALADALCENATMSNVSADFAASYAEYNAVGLAQGYVDEARPDYDYTTVPLDSTVRTMMSIENADALSAVAGPRAESSYNMLAFAECGYVAPFSSQNGYLVRALESSAAESGNFIVGAIVDAAYDWGFLRTAQDFVMRSVGEIVSAGGVSNLAFRPVVMLGIPFQLGGAGSVASERAPTVRMSPPHLTARRAEAAQVPHGAFTYTLSQPTGTHYTEMLTYNARPFETTWVLAVSGNVTLAVESDTRDIIIDGSHVASSAESSMPLSFCLSVSVYSGWNLSGVDYVTSATLAEDAGRLADMVGSFFSWVLDSIMAPIRWLVDQVMRLVDILGNVLNRLMSYAQRIIEAISETVQTAVELLQAFIRDTAASALSAVEDWLMDWLPEGYEISFQLFGFGFHVVLDPDSVLDGGTPEDDACLMSIGIDGKALGARIEMDAKILKLGEAAKSQTGASHDILMDIDVEVAGFGIALGIDPLMAVNEYIVEAHGGALGWKLDFALPVAERRYDSFGYSLQDVAGVGQVLQNIPIPFLGAKASVDAGFVVDYAEPGFLPDHVVINEVEANPRGSDNGTELVELFNPLQHNVSAAGWTLSVVSNGTLGNRTFELDANATLPPRGFLVVGIRNESMGDDGCRLVLADKGGAVVDSTHWLSEPAGGTIGNETVPDTGGGSTWQRSPNAADAELQLDWSFRQGTLNASNGAGNVTFKQLVMDTLERSFKAAWNESGEFRLSFDYVVGVARLTVEKFIEDVLDLVEASVVEVEFFIDVRLTDATGSGGGGFRLSFVIEGGEAARQILEWIIGSVEAFARNFMKPAAPAKYPSLAKGVPEHLFIRVEGYGIVSTPAALSKISPGSQAPSQMKLVGRLEANVPALAALVGKDIGRWRVNFGLYLERVPGSMLHDILGTPEDEDVDLWMLQGSAYEA
jgi:hypothetical protein